MRTANFLLGPLAVVTGAIAAAQPVTPPEFRMAFLPNAQFLDINDAGLVAGSRLNYGIVARFLNGQFDVTQLFGCSPIALGNTGYVVGDWSAPGSNSFSDGFILVPEDLDSNGSPDTWYRDLNNDGVNDLLRDLGTAFLWDGWLRGPVYVADVNSSGVVVGRCLDYNGYEHTFPFAIVPEDTDSDGIPDLWNRDANLDGKNDLMIILDIPPAHDSGVAEHVSDVGRISGTTWYFDAFDPRAVVWSSQLAVVSFGTLYGHALESWGMATDDIGRLVGWSSCPDANNPQSVRFHAVISTTYPNLIDLGKFGFDPGCAPTDTRAQFINNKGWIAGSAFTHYCTSGDYGGLATLLIPIRAGTPCLPTTWYYNSASEPPIDGANELIFELSLLVRDFNGQFSETAGMNNRGQIVTNDSGGAYLLTPCEQAGCPDFNDDGRVDVIDLASLLGAFGSNNDFGDADCDGDTDLTDLALVTAAFGTTCPCQ